MIITHDVKKGGITAEMGTGGMVGGTPIVNFELTPLFSNRTLAHLCITVISQYHEWGLIPFFSALKCCINSLKSHRFSDKKEEKKGRDSLIILYRSANYCNLGKHHYMYQVRFT